MLDGGASGGTGGGAPGGRNGGSPGGAAGGTDEGFPVFTALISILEFIGSLSLIAPALQKCRLVTATDSTTCAPYIAAYNTK